MPAVAAAAVPEVFQHRTVLLDELVGLVAPEAGKTVVDCTVGGGGHTQALLEAGATVIGFDRDLAALAAARARLSEHADRLTLINKPFSTLLHSLPGRVDGVIADLGVSSPQLDVAERGFSFMREGPLDMRMGAEGETAAELLDRIDLDELTRILREYGEERHARRIAKAILAARPFSTTTHLAEVVAAAMPGRRGRIHPATRTFQALRIATNDELGELEALLDALPQVLVPGGRAGIISFHSLEDRMVKQRFRSLAGAFTEKDAYGHPVSPPQADLLTRKAVTSSDDNPRARSARLRGLQLRGTA